MLGSPKITLGKHGATSKDVFWIAKKALSLWIAGSDANGNPEIANRRQTMAGSRRSVTWEQAHFTAWTSLWILGLPILASEPLLVISQSYWNLCGEFSKIQGSLVKIQIFSGLCHLCFFHSWVLGVLVRGVSLNFRVQIQLVALI